jgi:hypothetical protein
MESDGRLAPTPPPVPAMCEERRRAVPHPSPQPVTPARGSNRGAPYLRTRSIPYPDVRSGTVGGLLLDAHA